MKNVKTLVSFIASETKQELVKNAIFTSDLKSDELAKNARSRLRMNVAFVDALDEELDLIIKYSSAEKLEYLMKQTSNLKTSERILECAKMLCKKRKYTSSLDYVLRALRDNAQQNMTMLETSSNQCYSRLRNTVIALEFFKIVTVNSNKLAKNSQFLALDKSTTVTLIK